MAGVPTTEAGVIVTSVSEAVSGVAAAVTAYGPNDVGKAVAAAKKAGNAAKKLVGKQYPNWDFGGKKLAHEWGYETRGEWKNARAVAEQQAYDEAYQQVWKTYEDHVNAMTNQINNLNAQDALNDAAMADLANQTIGASLGAGDTSKGSMGCAMMSALLIISSIVLYLVF